MPRLIRTPEQVLRETKRDLHLIRFKQAGFATPKGEIPGRRELFAWFKRELPHIELEDLGPPESSGWIEGGIGSLVRVAFDDAALARYIEVWEYPDGANRDARWQCYHYPYPHPAEPAPKRKCSP